MRSRIVILIMLIVLLIPLCEFFDHGVDLNPDGDFVRALVCVFVSISVCLIFGRVISFLPQFFCVAMVPIVSLLHATSGAIEAAAFAPDSLLSLGNLRI